MLHLELCISFVQLLAAICLVNCCVVNVTTNRTIFPWSILSTRDSGVTVRQFYEEKVVNQLKSTGDVELEAAFLGKSKESLDIIDLSLSLDSAVPLFGPFLRYRTHSINQGSPPTRDALAILMSSQRQMSTSGLPPCVSVRTKKDQLFNDFVGLLKEENVAFPANEINSSGQMYTKLMVDSLWYVDGHHDTLQKQSFPVPQFFQRFIGYNTPELSKHRKRRCVSQHYSFQIKKCGSESCSVCGAIRLPKPVFDQLHFLPDPVPGEDGHYKGFKDLLGTKTDGTHRPSLQKASKRTKTLPFSASVQHVKNVDIMLQCDECCKWRLLYCKFKLTRKERADLQTGLQDVSFTCGAQLQDLELPGRLNEVYTRIMSCEQPIEKLYYSAKYSPICVYCAEDVESVPTDKYPQCVDCAGKPVIPKV